MHPQATPAPVNVTSGIVGFEHPANTDQEKLALAQAQKTLADPLAMFVLPNAGCKVDSTAVEQRFVNQSGPGWPVSSTGKVEEGAATHSDFHATYSLTCSDPSAVRSIDFRFFAIFPNTQTVNVQLVSDKGQKI